MGLHGGVIGTGDVSTPDGVASEDNPIPVKASIMDVCISVVRSLELIARAISMAAADPAGYGRLRAVVDVNSGTLTTCTTCSTVTNVTSLNQIAAADAKQTLLYDAMRTNWNTAVLSQIVIE